MTIFFGFRSSKSSSPAKKVAASTEAKKATFAVRAYRKLETWISTLYIILGQIESALEKGYYLVYSKDGQASKQMPVDELKRQELLVEKEAALFELAKAKKAFKKAQSKVRSIHAKNKLAARGKRQRLTTHARITKGIRKLFPVVKDSITMATLSSHKELAEYASVQIKKDTDFQELEKFFEQNLSGTYDMVKKDSLLARALYKKTVRHIQKIYE